MNKITKILLVSLSTLMIATLSACKSVTMSDEKVEAVAASIVDFDLPAGYTAEFSANLMGYSLASYINADGHSHLYLIQSENELDGEKLEQGLEKLVPDIYDSHTRMTILEKLPVTFRGQEVNAIFSEGVDSENGTYRQVTVAFQGKGGPALLVFSEPATKWNQEYVLNLLASMQ